MTQPEALRLADLWEKHSHGYKLTPEAKTAAELRRLHAKCEALTGDTIEEMRRINEIHRLTAQRDELLAALRLMLASHDATCPGEECQLSGVDLARAAIAKAQQ